MKRLSSTDLVPPDLRNGVVAIGNFDGYHRGQQAVVASARALAGAEGRPLIIATFSPHPDRYFDPAATSFDLTTLDQRERLFRRSGADAMLVFKLDEEMARLSASDFLERHLARPMHPSAIVVGRHCRFGPGRAGDVDVLRALAEPFGIGVHTVESVSSGDEVISATRIREALRVGDCGTATLLLSRPFSVEGVVVHGHQLGRTIGFPTANLLMGGYMRPRYGVYAVRGRLPGGRVIDGVANLGVRPMIDPPEELLEPHFLDFTGDLYHQVIEVELIQWLRDEVKLSGLNELAEWIRRDCSQAREVLAKTPHHA